MASGTCFGYEVRSSLDFKFLRPGSGTPLKVSEALEPEATSLPLVEWHLQEHRPFHARLHAEDGRFRLFVNDTGWFGIDPARASIVVPPGGDPVRREERLWAIPTLLCLQQRGDVGLHAAAVEVEGGAVLIAAPGYSGKTTLAAAFLQRGHRVLAEDITCCRPGDSPLVFPGPALLRVRRDSFTRLGRPDSSNVVMEEPHRVHLAMDDDSRGDGGPLPLRAVLLLRRGAGSCELERVVPERAVPDLMTLSFTLPTVEDRARSFAGIVDLARTVPVWNLVRPMTYEGVGDVVDHVVASLQ